MSHRPASAFLPALLLGFCFVASYAQTTGAQPAASSASAKPKASPAETYKPAGPADPRAQKTYQEGVELWKHHNPFAIDSFKKADKQDGNHCAACADMVLTLAITREDFKEADKAAQELIGLSTTPSQQSYAHVARAQLLLAEGKAKKKQECYAEGQKELETALALTPGDRPALYLKGVCLADQNQDDAAKQVFTALVPVLQPGSKDYERVARFAERPDLVRARMAPAFVLQTLDGTRISLDELKGRVVLIDFWATWCPSCVEALPHMQKIAKQFEGEPLVVLSISLDKDEAKWKDFVARHGMTWQQYRDGGWDGDMSRLFGVRAIPATFTIDSDGVLQDQHIGDGNIEGKLKKLVAQAREQQERKPQRQPLEASQPLNPGPGSR